MDCSPLICPWGFPGKNLESVAISYSRGSSPHRDSTRSSWISCTGSWIVSYEHTLGSPVHRANTKSSPASSQININLYTVGLFTSVFITENKILVFMKKKYIYGIDESGSKSKPYVWYFGTRHRQLQVFPGRFWGEKEATFPILDLIKSQPVVLLWKNCRQALRHSF